MKNKKAEMAKNLTPNDIFSHYCNNEISTNSLTNIKGGDGEATDDFIIIEDIVDL